MDILRTNIFIIRFSFWAGIVFVAGSSALFTAVIIRRFFMILEERRAKAFIDKWRPILQDSLYADVQNLPPIPNKDMFSFLLLWNNMQENLRGEAKDRLVILAQNAGIEDRVRRKLRSRRQSRRMVAVSAVGHLAKEDPWEEIESMVYGRNMTMSLTALHTLARINGERALHVLISFLMDVDEWPEYRIANILHEIGAQTYSEPLVTVLDDAAQSKKIALMELLGNGDRKVVIPLAKRLLREESDEEIVAAALKLVENIGDVREVYLVRHYLRHPTPFVRIRAVSAMGSIASEEDLQDLEECLKDNTWWVRFRAAQAIQRLPGFTSQKMQELKERQSDRFAVDILNYVMS